VSPAAPVLPPGPTFRFPIEFSFSVYEEILRVAQWVVISLLIAVSLALDATGHPTLSAGADVVADVVYVVSASAVGASRE
jgi:hypothetical protein